MAIEWKDRIIEHPRRYQLVPVAGETDVYDLVAVTGIVTEAGTPINAVNMSSIEDSIETLETDKVAKVADLASQAEAQAGTDNTKYMTPLRTREAISVVKGALVYMTTDSPTGAAIIPEFDAEVYDDLDFHSTSVNPERLTIPSGVSRVRLRANINTNYYQTIRIRRYNSSDVEQSSIGLPILAGHTVEKSKSGCLVSAILNVSEGEYFTLYEYNGSSSGIMYADRTWFEIEVIA